MTESERECVSGERGKSSDTYCPSEISEMLAKERKRERTYRIEVGKRSTIFLFNIFRTCGVTTATS